MKPTVEELCEALEELVEERALEREVLYDDWTRGSGRFADERDRRAIERMDRDLARYRDLLRRARRASARATGCELPCPGVGCDLGVACAAEEMDRGHRDARSGLARAACHYPGGCRLRILGKG